MENNKIVNHEITEKISISREMMAKQLQHEFKKHHIYKDDYDAEFLAEELTDSTELGIFVSTYDLEFLADILFEMLIKSNVLTYEKAKQLWDYIKNDDRGVLKMTYESVMEALKEV